MTDLSNWKKKLLAIVSKIDDDEYNELGELSEALEKLLDEIFESEEDGDEELDD